MSGNHEPTRLADVIDVTDELLTRTLQRWFEDGDRRAGKRAYLALQHRLAAPAELLRVLGHDEFDELRQELLTNLLTEPPPGFRQTSKPEAYARKALRNRALDRLRRKATRASTQGALATAPAGDRIPPERHVERGIDASRALQLAQALPFVTRMAILLTTRPACISAVDWVTLSARHASPLERPDHALDRDQASLLLYPAASDESPAERATRRNRFDQALRRGTNQLRQAMMEDV